MGCQLNKATNLMTRCDMKLKRRENPYQNQRIVTLKLAIFDSQPVVNIL